MYSLAKAHFKKVDAKLHKASLEHEIEDLVASEDLFGDIVRTIIGQQLSGKAADTIFGRFEKLFPKKLVTPEKILRLDDTSMRSAGLSGAKTRAIKSLAENVLSGTLDLKTLPSLGNNEVIIELTKVKGIGPWTAEMLLMFSLGKADVFSNGDLGLKKGIMHLYSLKKLPSDRTMKKITAVWSPWRTYASRVLWRVADAKKSVASKQKRRL